MATAEQTTLPPSNQVIRAKIRPPFTEGWVERPRPEGLLAEAVESRRVAVVSATAGAGKTTLLAAVAARLHRPVAWLTLDATDTAPGRLVTYLEAALAVVVPRAEGVAREALSARIPHAEAAGLLVESVAGENVVLVVDELERLGDDDEAWTVIEALLRHGPPDMRCVLSSRRPVPPSVLPRCPHEVALLGDEVLALTTDEAAGVLQELGRPPVDPVAVVEATGGWVTGVVFEAWRFAEETDGDELDDPLHSYLSAHIIGDLPAEDREFLIATSVLDDVTPARAGALGVQDACARLASLRHAHIPATWSDVRTLRCHPRFREYLQDCLLGWEAERLRELEVSHGRLLACEGHHEEATEVLLRAGATAEALESAAFAIFAVIERLDFTLALRWLDALADVEPDGMSPFVMARLMLALATENPAFGVALADRLASRGKLEEVAASSSAAAWMLSVCYGHLGRYDEMLAAFALAPHDDDYEALRAFMGIYGTEPDPPFPELTGGKFDSALLPIISGYGRLARVLEIAEPGGWMQGYFQPWVIATLGNAGRMREALDLYEVVQARGINISVDASVGPRLLTDLGRREEALQAIRRGRRRARETGAVIYELLGTVEEGRMRLRLDRDAAGALEALKPVDRHPMTHRIPFLGPQVDCWIGCALLLQGRDAEARERLRRAARILHRTDQLLYMPEIGVYLAEAEWRLGDEDAADAAADMALEAARVQGFNHMLLLGLRDFPAVLSRRLDAEPAADSPWHELSRALRAQGLGAKASQPASVELREFGRVAILVEGEEKRPRIAKTYELLAYLLTRGHSRAERDELLEVLFDARADDSARAYLRQAIHWLRSMLPPDGVVASRAGIALSDGVTAVSDSGRLEQALARAASLRGADRLAAITSALEIVDQGVYLPGIASRWVDERRQQLREIATDARYDAAELAFSEGRVEEAARFTEAVLEAEPFHEPAWRLTMRLASAQGDAHGVLRSYQRCERVLAEVGAEPAATTRQLVDQLRR